MPTAPPKAFPKHSHNHAPCMASALARAQAAFTSRQLRLTDLRRMVFEEIAASHSAVGAYDVLDRLAQKGTRLAPISVYRALEALLEAGIVHRLESHNAYFACHAAHVDGSAQVVLNCTRCGSVAEVGGEKVIAAIETAAAKVDFRATTSIVEVSGLCGHCA